MRIRRAGEDRSKQRFGLDFLFEAFVCPRLLKRPRNNGKLCRATLAQKQRKDAFASSASIITSVGSNISMTDKTPKLDLGKLFGNAIRAGKMIEDAVNDQVIKVDASPERPKGEQSDRREPKKHL